MSNAAPDTVDVWAPVFVYFGGTNVRKYTDEQLLDPNFAVTFGHCKLCDSHVQGSIEEHLKTHRAELKTWRKYRAAEAEKNSLAGLAAARAEKKLLKESGINEPVEEDEDA